jgi:hypothetical protein
MGGSWIWFLIKGNAFFKYNSTRFSIHSIILISIPNFLENCWNLIQGRLSFMIIFFKSCILAAISLLLALELNWVGFYLWSMNTPRIRCVRVSHETHRYIWLHRIMPLSQIIIGVDVSVYMSCSMFVFVPHRFVYV